MIVLSATRDTSFLFILKVITLAKQAGMNWSKFHLIVQEDAWSREL